jgi:hypothetical protein
VPPLPTLGTKDSQRHPYAVAYLRYLAGEAKRPNARALGISPAVAATTGQKVEQLTRKAAARMLIKDARR